MQPRWNHICSGWKIPLRSEFECGYVGVNITFKCLRITLSVCVDVSVCHTPCLWELPFMLIPHTLYVHRRMYFVLIFYAIRPTQRKKENSMHHDLEKYSKIYSFSKYNKTTTPDRLQTQQQRQLHCQQLSLIVRANMPATEAAILSNMYIISTNVSSTTVSFVRWYYERMDGRTRKFEGIFTTYYE